jgi:hypothetical protein
VVVEEGAVECVMLTAIVNDPHHLIKLPPVEAQALIEGQQQGAGWVSVVIVRQQVLAPALVAQDDWPAWKDLLLGRRAAKACLS